MNTKDELSALKRMVGEARDAQASYIDSIIANLAKPPEFVGRRLAVPWVSQLGPTADFAPGDCGPACLASWLRWLGHSSVTVNQVSANINLPRGYRYTMPAHLIRAAQNWNFNLYWRRDLSLDHLRAEIRRGQPCIVLVHYGNLPMRVKFDKGYTSGHWLLMTGYDETHITYLDPYWRDSGEMTIDALEFFYAWNTNNIDGNSNRQALRAW